ncbi:MAG TPA: transglycosylase SLT domain-containing protein, partial [Thermoanaerobaculia bacterium]|nr:transglycosylase SLT domain-containing protein [Thermoanaerobaculia bacterium]
AGAARRLERPEVAAEALSRLLAEERDSPLLGRAYVEVAALAWDQRQAERALAWLAEARDAGLADDIAAQAEVLAWEIGRETGDREVQAVAAKRLLVSAPDVAREHQVHRLFAGPDGSIDSWEGVLTPEQVLERARSWVELGMGRSAMFTLETLPDSARGLDWRLVMSEAMVLQERGREALDVLDGVRPRSERERVLVEWQRARATGELATARRGRANLPLAERRRLLARSQRHLENVVETGADRELSVAALRQLYGQLAEAGLFEAALEKLRLLRRLDPTDRTGAEPLWERGWRDYLRDNYTGAIGYWTELEELYPRDRETRRARYWKARAWGELGEADRAQTAFRAVLSESDAADFYFGRAAARVAGPSPVPTATAKSAEEPWQIDPLLDRTLRLAELGLVGLAGEELELVAAEDGIDEQHLLAMEGLLMVRSGEPRDGVGMLRGAYPALASPYQAAAPAPVLTAYYPFLYGDEIEEHARRTRLPPHLVAGIIRQESAFDVRAESWAGARGLMQLMPATAKEVAGKLGRVHRPAELFDPEYSILLGTTYFRYVLDRFDGNVELALAGYNGGPNRIRRLWREAGPNADLDYFLETLPIPESQSYVKRILVLADSYRQLYWPEEEEVVASTEDVRL